MLKVMLLGGAMLLTIPAFAQTGTSAAGSGQVSTGIHTSAPGTNTDTNTMTGVTGVPPSTTTQSQTNWGTNSSTTNSTGINTSTSTGTSTGTGMSTNMGTSLSTGSTMPTGTGLSTSTTGSAYTGMGGPEDPSGNLGPAGGAKRYPHCSRTVRDNCTQIGPRRR